MLPKIKIKNRTVLFKLRQDRAILIVCIGIAFVFWILVKLSQTYQTEKAVEFHVTVPDELTFTNIPPQDMVVNVEGTGWDLFYEFLGKPRLILPYDMSNRDRLNLNRGQLRGDIQRLLSANDIRIIEVNYDNVNLVLEEKVSKTVPVRLIKELQFATEYHLLKPVDLNPDSVQVTGPGSVVNTIHGWETDSLKLFDIKSDIIQEVLLVAPPPGLSLNVASVGASVFAEQFTEKALFLPLNVKNAPEDSLKVFPDKIRVTCVVGLSHYNEVVLDSFQVEVDLANVAVSEKRNTAPIHLTRYPAYVKNVQFTPKSAEFFIVQQEVPADGEAVKNN